MADLLGPPKAQHTSLTRKNKVRTNTICGHRQTRSAGWPSPYFKSSLPEKALE